MLNKKLIENFLSLSVLQGLNFILPLLTLPYLLRVLGPENFGLLAFAQSFIQIFVILTDYGFNLTATSQISVNKHDKKKVSDIFSSVLFIKVMLLIISLLILIICLLSFNKLYLNWEVFIFTFGLVIGAVSFPVWFFQGIEDMKYITIFNVISKLIYTSGIFLFVKNSSDFLLVPIINSIGAIMIGFVSLLFIYLKYRIRFTFPPLQFIKIQLREGWYVFISVVATSFYTVSNTFILGLFTNNTIVGYYSTAEKIINAANGFLGVASQTIFPYISNLVAKSRNEGMAFIRRAFAALGSVSLAIAIFILVFAGTIIDIIGGGEYKESVKILRILSFLPLLVSVSNVLGIQTMLPFGYKKAFSVILVTASIINILLALLTVPVYMHIGTAVAVVISETFVVVAMFVYLRKKKLLFVGGKNV